MWRSMRVFKAASGLAASAAAVTLTGKLGTTGSSDSLQPINTRQVLSEARKTGSDVLGIQATAALRQMDKLVIYSGSSHPELADEIAYELDKKLSKIELGRYADGEVSVRALESVRGKDVFIIQSTSKPVNEHLMELLLMVSAMKRASAQTITVCMPYYGYKRDVGSVSSLTHQLQAEAVDTDSARQGVLPMLAQEGSTTAAAADEAEAAAAAFAAAEAAGAAAGGATSLPADTIRVPADSLLLRAGLVSSDGKPLYQLVGMQAGAASPTAAGAEKPAVSKAVGAAASAAAPAPSSAPSPSLSSPAAAVAAAAGIVGRQEVQGRISSFPIAAADVARMLEVLGVDRVIAVELQPPGAGQMEGFFGSRVPVENLRSTALAVQHLAKLKLQNPVVVAPNESCIQLAFDFSKGLSRAMAAGAAAAPSASTATPSTGSSSSEEVDVPVAIMVEAGPSRGADRYVHTQRKPLEQTRIELVGDVAGRDVLLVDDLIDTGFTLMRRVDLLKEKGAKRVVAYATHGLFNGSALRRITRSALSDVVVTNTVPLREDVDVRHTHKIAQLSIAPVIAEAILRVQISQSLKGLRVFDLEERDSRYKGQE